MTKPLISVLTPAYNAMPYLENAVASVARADAGVRIEHVIADAASTDGSVEFLSTTDTNWRSQPDRGQSHALNEAFAMSSGEWIGWLNADEYYLDGVLADMLEFLSETDADVIFGDFIEVKPDRSAIRLVAGHSVSKSVITYGYAHCVPSCSVFIRRSAIEKVGGWREDARLTMDWQLCWAIYRAGGKFHYTGKPHSAFTRHDQQVSVVAQDLVVKEREGLYRQMGMTGGRGKLRLARGIRIARKAANGAYLRELAFKRRLPLLVD